MKKIPHKLALLIALIIFSSCQKNFLELNPEGRINTENFYNSPVDFQQALTGAYVPLRDIANVAFFMDEMRSDNSRYDYDPKDRGGIAYEQLADFLDNSQNGVIGTRYAAAYNGISRCNVILDRLETISFTMAEADKKQITGEAKALRAHYYFDLVRHYGALPLHLHEVKSIAESRLRRTAVDTVYMQVIKDFSDALTLLKPPNKFPQSGRVTKGMAATELALAYMTRKEWDKAIPLLQSVSAMGYALMDNYGDVFSLSNKNGIESIFEVQYKSGTDGQSGPFIYRFVPIRNTLVTLGLDYNNSLGGWNIPTEDIISNYENNDKRLNVSIGVVEGIINKSADFTPTRVANFVGYNPTPGTTYRLFVKKYYHYPYTQVPSRTEYFAPENWPVFRFSDALLMLAESLNEKGRGGEALPYLNRVRARAGLADITAADQPTLRALIAKERRTELAFENKRWLDLVRTGEAITTMTRYGNQAKRKFSYLLDASYDVTENRLIFAIPFREVQLNSLLTQNPGY
ncbi:MAG: RagB/SusD family nutrient uptake outer membrane protein [Candidatus Nephrothrix sp. EaCA]|nr:MAG: RagB/SusD family nutrient uptake outer membrane protein [Candidatus Nephrothrix sp. EaCA]